MGGDSIYNQEFEKKFAWSKSSKKGKHYAYCTVCYVDFCIARGTYSFNAHENRIKHVNNVTHAGSNLEGSIHTRIEDLFSK